MDEYIPTMILVVHRRWKWIGVTRGWRPYLGICTIARRPEYEERKPLAEFVFFRGHGSAVGARLRTNNKWGGLEETPEGEYLHDFRFDQTISIACLSCILHNFCAAELDLRLDASPFHTDLHPDDPLESGPRDGFSGVKYG